MSNFDFKFRSANVNDDYKLKNVRIRADGLTLEDIDGKYWRVVSYRSEDEKVLNFIRELVHSHPDARDDNVYHVDDGDLIYITPYSGWRNSEGYHIVEHEFEMSPKVKALFKDTLVKSFKP